MRLNFAVHSIALLCALSFNVYSIHSYDDNEQIVTYDVQEEVASINEDNKIQYLEREIRFLINRVELLEHKLSLFEGRVNNELTQTREDQSQGPNNDSEMVKADDAKLENPATYAYDIAIIEFKKNNLPGAQELFKRFIDKHPKSNLISNGYFWYAETFYKQNKFDLAAINYFKGYHAAPKGAKALDSLLQGAASLGYLKKGKEACSILDKISKEFPNKSTSATKRTKELKDKFGCGGKR